MPVSHTKNINRQDRFILCGQRIFVHKNVLSALCRRIAKITYADSHSHFCDLDFVLGKNIQGKWIRHQKEKMATQNTKNVHVKCEESHPEQQHFLWTGDTERMNILSDDFCTCYSIGSNKEQKKLF